MGIHEIPLVGPISSTEPPGTFHSTATETFVPEETGLVLDYGLQSPGLLDIVNRLQGNRSPQSLGNSQGIPGDIDSGEPAVNKFAEHRGVVGTEVHGDEFGELIYTVEGNLAVRRTTDTRHEI